jgi:hypothetical protein
MGHPHYVQFYNDVASNQQNGALIPTHHISTNIKKSHCLSNHHACQKQYTNKIHQRLSKPPFWSKRVVS